MDADEEEGVDRRVKAAVIGLGRIGYEFGLEKGRVQPASHFHCYEQCSLIDEIAACDNDQKKLSAIPPTGKPGTIFRSYEEMMSKIQPDIVSICTPTSTHKDITCAVAKHKPKTIILEKPIAQSLNEADAIIGECKKNHVVLYVNYGRRWSAPYRSLVIPSSRDIVTMIGHHPGPLIRTGTHMIDVFNMLMYYDINHGKEAYEDDVMVQAFGKPVLADYMKGTDDYNISGVIQYGDDTSAILIANPIGPKLVLFELDIICKESRHVITENGLQYDIYGLSNSRRYEALKELKHLTMNRYEEENILQNALREIILHTTLDSMNLGNGKSARETLRLALGLHYSAMNDNQILPVKAVPLDYTVRSY